MYQHKDDAIAPTAWVVSAASQIKNYILNNTNLGYTGNDKQTDEGAILITFSNPSLYVEIRPDKTFSYYNNERPMSNEKKFLDFLSTLK